MSKFTKLIKHPVLFFKDAINKPVPNKPVPKKPVPKKPVPKKPVPINRDEYNYNKFELYSHLLHTGEDITGLSHLDLWLPHFIKADVNFVVMVRNYELFQIIVEKYPQLTITFAKVDKDVGYYLDQLVFLKACFYPSNTGRNMHLLKFNKIKHIFIGHGDSDKTASAHKYFRVYDENWVAGKAHIDRFVNEGFDFSGLESVEVGRPNLKETLEISKISWENRFDGQLNLLYLSTWEGVYQEQNYTSVYMIEEFFNKNLIEFDHLKIKLHPWVGRRDKSLENFASTLDELLSLKGVDYTIYDKTTPVEELIKQSNIFICDISAVISESLAANGPIFVYIPKDKDIKLTKSKMSYADYTYTFSTLDELIEQIEDVIINKNDYLAKRREEAMEYILGRDETLADTFIEKLKGI